MVSHYKADNYPDFNPRPLCRGRRREFVRYWGLRWTFQSTPPMQGATRDETGEAIDKLEFQSTPPMQGATARTLTGCFAIWLFQSTPPMQGATRLKAITVRMMMYFNPRPLCRGRLSTGSGGNAVLLFQSTPPMQGATPPALKPPQKLVNFNPRPLCRGRHQRRLRHLQLPCHFNPRPLCRGRQLTLAFVLGVKPISIHAPYAGGDQRDPCVFHSHHNFNPRPLCRGRQWRSCRTR